MSSRKPLGSQTVCPRKFRGLGQARNELENYCSDLRDSLFEAKQKMNSWEAGDLEKAEEALLDTMDWLDTNQMARKDEYEAKHKELEVIACPAMETWLKNEYMEGLRADLQKVGNGEPLTFQDWEEEENEAEGEEEEWGNPDVCDSVTSSEKEVEEEEEDPQSGEEQAEFEIPEDVLEEAFQMFCIDGKVDTCHINDVLILLDVLDVASDSDESTGEQHTGRGMGYNEFYVVIRMEVNIILHLKGDERQKLNNSRDDLEGMDGVHRLTLPCFSC